MPDNTASAAVLDRPRHGTVQQEDLALNIPPLSYTTLRLIAETAVGIGNAPLQLAAGGTRATAGTVVWQAEPPQSAPPTAVLVPAQDTGKYTELDSLTMQVTWTPSSSAPPVTGTVDAVQSNADAVFWSDSAVQKFVFSYLASCSGWQAAQNMAQLQNAWNFYPTGELGVFALMHVVPPAGEPIGLGNSFAVAFAAPDGVQVLPLDQLSLAPRSYEPPPASTVSFEQVPVPGSNAAGYPDYVKLRAMAEWAGSLSTEAQFFVWSPGTNTIQTPSANPTLAPGDVVIPAYNPAVPAGRPTPASVFMAPAGGTGQELQGLADAAFWNAGSIQQFLFPYYASVCGFEAPQALQDIIDAWNLNEVGTGPHNTFSFTVREVEVVEEELEDEVVYGLVHLPKSAWMTVEELEVTFWSTLGPDHQARLIQYHSQGPVGGHFALREMGVLHGNRRGTHLLPLGDFKELHPQYFHFR
jgi:hypothetical protein